MTQVQGQENAHDEDIASQSPGYVLGFTSICFAQIKSATITEAIPDSGRACVPGASALVIQQATNACGAMKITSTGNITTSYCSPGRYTVQARASGFAGYIRRNVRLV
jgi:hypothetical protein